MFLDRDSVKNKIKYGWFAALVILFVFLHYNMDLVLTSDDASELIFGQYLSQGWNIFSSGWHYSTELRVINTQIVYGLLFKFMDNWHNVRLLGNGILLLLTIGALKFWLKSCCLENYFPIVAILVVTPVFWSNLDCYYIFNIVGAYYLPHICFLLLLFGLIFRFSENNNQSRAFYLVLSLIISFASALGGSRQLFIFHIPIVITIAIFDFKKWHEYGFLAISKKYWSFAFFNLLVALLALLINRKVFPLYFSYADMEKLHFIGFDMSKALLVLKGYLANFGFISGVDLHLIDILVNLNSTICFLSALSGIYIVLKNAKYNGSALEFMAIYNVVMLVLYVVLFSMTSMYYMNRYVLQTLIILYPFIILPFIDLKKQKLFIPTVGCVTILSLVSVMNFYKNIITTDINHDNREIVTLLQEQEYSNGYATFWNGNILTELSNGKVEVWTLRYNFPQTNNIDDLYAWLQKKSHFTQKPEGKVFLYLDQQERKKVSFCKKLDKERSHIIYDSGNNVLYGFTNYGQLKEIVNGK